MLRDSTVGIRAITAFVEPAAERPALDISSGRTKCLKDFPEGVKDQLNIIEKSNVFTIDQIKLKFPRQDLRGIKILSIGSPGKNLFLPNIGICRRPRNPGLGKKHPAIFLSVVLSVFRNLRPRSHEAHLAQQHVD